MASDNSFDVVSKVDLQEVKNAIDQASKEVHARFDPKDSKSKSSSKAPRSFRLASQSEYSPQGEVIEILSQQAGRKRGVSLMNPSTGILEPASNSSVRQEDRLLQAGRQLRCRQEDRVAKDSRRVHGSRCRLSHPGRHRARRLQATRRYPAAGHGQAARRATSASRCSSPTTAVGVSRPLASQPASGFRLRPATWSPRR